MEVERTGWVQAHRTGHESGEGRARTGVETGTNDEEREGGWYTTSQHHRRFVILSLLRMWARLIETDPVLERAEGDVVVAVLASAVDPPLGCPLVRLQFSPFRRRDLVGGRR